MRTLGLSAGVAMLLGTAAWADDADCKFCASEVVIRPAQLECLKQKVDQAAREIGDKKTVLIDLLSCGASAGGNPGPSTMSPPAPAPIAGAPASSAPSQIYRLTRAGLACIQRQLPGVAAGQDPIRISTTCS